MRWREVAKDERKAERISKLSALDNRRVLRRRAVFLHGVHSADTQNRRRSLSRHTPPKRIHSRKLAARAVHDRVRANSRRMADDKFSAPAAHFLEAVHRRADNIYNVFSLPPVGLFRRKDRYKTEIYLRLLGAVGSIPAMPQPVSVLVCGFVHISRSVRRPAYHGDLAHVRGIRRAREFHSICRSRDCFCRRGISGAVLRRCARAAGDSADFFGISTQARIPSIHSAPAERGFRRCSGFLARASRARSDGSGVGF